MNASDGSIKSQLPHFTTMYHQEPILVNKITTAELDFHKFIGIKIIFS